MSTTGRVLIVDDYEANVSALRLLLERQGYEVVTASNGRDALHLVHRDRPDLVLLDVMMPEVSGIDVCASLKTVAETSLIPVVLVSAVQERTLRLEGLEAGADDFLNKPIDPEELYARVRSLIRLKRLTDDLESAESLFLTLGRIIEARDPYTEDHCDRLAQYATALGRALALADAELDALYRGAFLHDVGKIAIPDRVLLKKGRLTPDEMTVMKQHPVIGDDLCRTVRSFDNVRPIVRHHHERRDGRGYPDGLAGDQIPLLARIVAVVDVFDALTTDRPYRAALTVDAALAIMRDDAAKGWCEIALLEKFVEIMPATVEHAARRQQTAGEILAPMVDNSRCRPSPTTSNFTAATLALNYADATGSR
jgi:putative two-component system response regulator